LRHKALIGISIEGKTKRGLGIECSSFYFIFQALDA
jgi:hypothetical protein